MAIQIQGQATGCKTASMPMAPMIDMVFLLLVFFMTASAMSQAGTKLELDLPESPNAQVAEDFSGRLVVSVDPKGNYFLGTERMELSDLQKELTAFKERHPLGKLSVRAAKETPFAAVRAAMESAAAAGIQNYLYATYQVGGE